VDFWEECFLFYFTFAAQNCLPWVKDYPLLFLCIMSRESLILRWNK